MKLEYIIYDMTGEKDGIFTADPAKEDPFDVLKETLYIWWGLIPSSPNWKEELSDKCETQFLYEEEDSAIVVWDGRDFEVWGE